MNAQLNLSEHKQLTEMLKALADENRLTLIQLLSQEEIAVGDLADRVGISEPTVSHHLTKLREVGLVTLRMDRNRRLYRADQKGVATFKRLVASIEQPPAPEEPAPDQSWIETLGWPEDELDVLRHYTKGGKLVQVPIKQTKRLLVILKWLATMFEADRTYTEREVTDILRMVNNDPAGLRRDLIDFRLLSRDRGGMKYWLTPVDEEVKA